LAEWMLPPEYLNPTEFGPMDHRVDIYHCALLLLQLLRRELLSLTRDEVLAGKPRHLAVEAASPHSFALEKALRRHVQARTASAMELWRDLNTPLQPGTQQTQVPAPETPQIANDANAR